MHLEIVDYQQARRPIVFQTGRASDAGLFRTTLGEHNDLSSAGFGCPRAAFSSVMMSIATVVLLNGESCDNPTDESSKDGNPVRSTAFDITQPVFSVSVGLRCLSGNFPGFSLWFHLNLLLQIRPTRDLTIE